MIRFTRPLKSSKLMGPASPAPPWHVIIAGMGGRPGRQQAASPRCCDMGVEVSGDTAVSGVPAGENACGWNQGGRGTPRARCSCVGLLSIAGGPLAGGGLVPVGVASSPAAPPRARVRAPTGRRSGSWPRRSSRRERDARPRRSPRTRSTPARGAEPADERHRRSPRVRAPQRDRHRQHPHDRQAQHGVQRDLPAHVLERRAEQHGAEDQERDAVEQPPRSPR